MSTSTLVTATLRLPATATGQHHSAQPADPPPPRSATSLIFRAFRALAPLSVVAVFACTGLTLGDNAAGQDTFMELGAIAVDAETDTSFVLRKATSESGTVIKTLWAVPKKGAPKAVATLDGQGDVRVLFPKRGVLLMAEENGQEFLSLLDRHTLKVIDSATHSARYFGTRMSPSRRWVAVADNKNNSLPIILIDTNDLSAHALPGKADWKEAMWARTSDTLFAMSSWQTDASKILWSGGWSHTRLMAWQMDQVIGAQFTLATDGFWANPLFDIKLDGRGPSLLFSFSWVGVAPNDDAAVFPVIKAPANKGEKTTFELAVVDLDTHEVRFVQDAMGPVGFTPDGTSIISYRNVKHAQGDDKASATGSDAETFTGQDLLAIDLKTLAVEQLTVPFSGLINFFVTGAGHFVVVAGWTGNSRLALFDLDGKASSTVKGPNLDLHEVVARPSAQELWICDDGLYRLRVVSGVLDTIAVPFVAWHANRLPTADQIVVGNRDGSTLVYLAPQSGAVVRTVHLPEPQ